MVYKCFDKKSKGGGVNIEVKASEQLPEELENFKKEQFIQDLKTIFGELI